jgi:hypothetical protein
VITSLYPLHPCADDFGYPRTLVAKYHGISEEIEVRPADARRDHAYEDLVIPGAFDL